MFSKPLFIQSFKSNKMVWTVVTAVMCLMLLQFQALKNDTMNLTSTLFYGMMSMMISTLYVVITANKLLASQVDSGSMAYVLSTPIKRGAVAFTQAMFLVGSLFVTFAFTTIVHLVTNAIFHSDAFTVGSVFALNLGSFVLAATLGGICFMFSGIFNLSKTSLGTGGMISVWFMLATMLGMFSTIGLEALKIFKYTTITTLFDSESIMAGTTAWLWKLAILCLIGVGTYVAGSVAFSKKNLPL